MFGCDHSARIECLCELLTVEMNLQYLPIVRQCDSVRVRQWSMVWLLSLLLLQFCDGKTDQQILCDEWLAGILNDTTDMSEADFQVT